MFDVVTVGNGILDTFLTLPSGTSEYRYDEETKELCVKAGEKILIERCDFQLGGNASNVAVGLSRLGFRAALMAELADDEFSEKIINGLQRENVNLDLVKRVHGQSSFTVGLHFKEQRTLFVEHKVREHDFNFSSLRAGWVYLTSLGQKWEHVYEKIASNKRQLGFKLACNPGSVQLASGHETFSYLFPLIDILFLNKTEAERIVGPQISMAVLLKKMQELGSSIVCLTDGSNGANAISEDGEIYHQDKLPAHIVEVTGAGDSFATGFLGATMSGKSIPEALLWGVTNAASVISTIGSQPGLLKKSEMEDEVRGALST